jgi:hypothetical protein
LENVPLKVLYRRENLELKMHAYVNALWRYKNDKEKFGNIFDNVVHMFIFNSPGTLDLYL